MEAVAKEAARQHLDQWDQDAYVAKIAALAGTLHLEDPVLLAGMQQLTTRLKDGRIDFEDLEKRVDFSICLLQFDTHEVIPAHDHPGMTGMILCAAGEIQTANFDELPAPEDGAAPAGHCLLRRVSQQVLRKNDISTLTAKARNIHTLRATQPTQLVDIFTPPYNEQRTEASRWFAINPKAQPDKPDVFQARVIH